MRALLCHNPDAGTGDHSAQELLGKFRRLGIEVNYCSVHDEQKFPACLSQAADLVIAAGGDGTVAKVATQMPDRNVPLLIVPVGTANNIARSLGISEVGEEPLSRARLERTRNLNICAAVGDFGRLKFIEAFGIGPIAHSMTTKTGTNVIGKEKLRAGTENLRRSFEDATRLEMTMSVDGALVPADTLIAVEILNLTYTGPALRLLREGNPSYGRLAVLVIEEAQRSAVLDWLYSDFAAPIPVPSIEARHIEITWKCAHSRLDDETFDPVEYERSIALESDGAPVRVVA